MAPLPISRDERSAAFFDAAAQGTLLLRWSPATGAYLPPTAHIDPSAPLSPLEWRPVAGTGEIVTWTVLPPGGDVVALVELAEGPWLTVAVRGVAPTALHEGYQVRIGFERPEGGEAVPVALPR
ncbi:Zn-ribbon domain-containing OB-fold protein [Streptomyces spongiae]|uniref:ChsH2 C-terminal OB-fold domain-containing protein n=1 Tax=Streptomyces spongiae TaxID=565072 RepID=A0A5N8XAU7_9ACTN|nr:OB-fold domain-containing protein [Streptomyces spongiae]MPY56517.1 hypothetical protein [Streptomyces spongiae]